MHINRPLAMRIIGVFGVYFCRANNKGTGMSIGVFAVYDQIGHHFPKYLRPQIKALVILLVKLIRQMFGPKPISCS